jgi:hypothetical protein
MSDELISHVQGSLIDLVSGMKHPDTHKMVQSMERLDALLAMHRDALDPRLAHFLERRSYAKALEFLSGGRPASGACGTRV